MDNYNEFQNCQVRLCGNIWMFCDGKCSTCEFASFTATNNTGSEQSCRNDNIVASNRSL